jgi:hypothetical protein
MSSLAAMIAARGAVVRASLFDDFVQQVARHKSLPMPTESLVTEQGIAAKFNAPSARHTTVARDAASGSWLIAAGTLIDAVAPDDELHNLLMDYLARGAGVFARCDGLFALIVYDGSTKQLAVVSDPFGYFSVFYGSRDGCTFVSTSALAVAQQIQSPPSELGVNCFLRTGKVFGEMTLWRDVKRLRAATVLEFTPGGARESVYWRPAFDPRIARLSFEDAIDASLEHMQAVIRRNLAREGKVWTDLTGGFDTRLLVLLLDRAHIPFKANFVGIPNDPDVRIAHTIVRELNWEHRHFQLPQSWPQECPAYLQDALGRGDAHLNVLLLLRALWAHRQESREYAVLLSGLGGEMWRGPIWWPERAALGQSKDVHYDRQLWSLMHPIDETVLVAVDDAQVRRELIEQFTCAGEQDPDALNTFKLDLLWTYRETAHVGAWASVAAGLVRILPPLFSKDIVSFLISLDYRWRLKNKLVRHLFAKYHPILANLEVEGRGPALPRRWNNAYRFIPSRLAYYRRALNKLAEIRLGRSLWVNRRSEVFSPVEWRSAILDFVEGQGLFRPGEMRSGKLYRREPLRALLDQARTSGFRQDEFLGRIITIEMALRASGTALD